MANSVRQKKINIRKVLKSCASVAETSGWWCFVLEINARFSYYLEEIRKAKEEYVPCNITHCQCYLPQIKKDLQPFKDGITKQLLENVKNKLVFAFCFNKHCCCWRLCVLFLEALGIKLSTIDYIGRRIAFFLLDVSESSISCFNWLIPYPIWIWSSIRGISRKFIKNTVNLVLYFRLVKLRIITILCIQCGRFGKAALQLNFIQKEWVCCLFFCNRNCHYCHRATWFCFICLRLHSNHQSRRCDWLFVFFFGFCSLLSNNRLLECR